MPTDLREDGDEEGERARAFSREQLDAVLRVVHTFASLHRRPGRTCSNFRG